MKRKTINFLAGTAFLCGFMMILFGIILMVTHWLELGGLIGAVLFSGGALSIIFFSWLFKKIRKRYERYWV